MANKIFQTALESYIQRIDNNHYNTFVNIYRQEAKSKACALDQKIIQNKKIGKMEGKVVALKDLFCYKDHPVQACSKILQGFISQIQATAVERLLNEDAIIIGHNNCDEFGMGASNENTIFGPVLHPLNNAYVPGGSSGGSAVAIKKDLCAIALGTDTGGSIRQPASFCGVIGFKPTYSRISRHGVIAYSSSLDTVGILSKHIRDIQQTLTVIAGKDTFDNTVSQKKVPCYTENIAIDKKKIRIAYIKEMLEGDMLQQEVKDHTLKAIAKMKQAGHYVDIISFPYLDYVLPTYHIISSAEASANLARYDGVRYGYRAKTYSNLEEMYVKTRTEGFGNEVKRRILLGTFVLTAERYKNYFLKAQKVRRLIQNYFLKLFQSYHFIFSPTTPTTAFARKAYITHPQKMYFTDLYTVPASLAGIPAISLPCGKDNKGLPIGIQIMAPFFEEHSLLSFAEYLINEKIVMDGTI